MILFRQGDFADSVFYIQEGRAKLTLAAPDGEEAVLALLSFRDFVREECIDATARGIVYTTSANSEGTAQAEFVAACTNLACSRRRIVHALGLPYDA